MVFVFIKGAKNTNASFAGLAVETDDFILVLLALNILLDLHVENAVVACDLGLLVELHALFTQQFSAIQALGSRLAVLMVHHLANIAKRELTRPLSADDLSQIRHQKVIRQLLNSSNWQLCTFAAQRARELAVVAVLLVSRLRHDMVLDAFLTECVEAIETLGVLVDLQADLTNQELIVDLLGEFPSGRHHLESSRAGRSG